MPGLAWTEIFLFMLPHVAGMTGACHTVQPLVEVGVSCERFAEDGLET
jgi:hypothetical protein